jgi:hypothetical protein
VTRRPPHPGGGTEAGSFLVGVGFAVAILGFVMTAAFTSAQWWQARRDVLFLRELGVAGPVLAGVLSTVLAVAVASLPYVRATPWLGVLAAVLAAVGASRMLWKR